MKGRILLKKIEIRNFTPVTDAGDYVKNKKQLMKEIRDKIPKLQELRDNALGNKLCLEVCFYLNNNTKEEGNWQKDLDNLLNVVFDVLPQHFTDETNSEIEGLGLTKGKSDYMVHEVLATKKFVNSHELEGIDLEIYEWVEKTSFMSKIKLLFN